MATINRIDSNIPIEIEKGGTANTTFNLHGSLAYVTGTPNTLQSTTVGDTGTILTSQGSGSLPYWVGLPTFFKPLSSDPASPMIGDTWYNTTSNLFKGAKGGSGSSTWVVKASLNSEMQQGSGAGTGADGLVFAGTNSSVAPAQAQRYTGTSDTWANVASLPVSNTQPGGAGTASSALCFGGISGSQIANTQFYNGTSWSSGGALNQARGQLSGAGTSTSALSFAGIVSGTSVATTESYNGTSWTVQSSLNNSFYAPQGDGISSDALVQGGFNSSSGYLSTSERYNGTVWTNKASASVVRIYGAAAGANGGACMVYGGYNSGTVYSSTELYNGGTDTWSGSANLNLGRYYLSGMGSTLDALATGGRTGSSAPLTYNERFQSTSVTVVPFTLT